MYIQQHKKQRRDSRPETGVHERPKADGTGAKGKAEARSTGGS